MPRISSTPPPEPVPPASVLATSRPRAKQTAQTEPVPARGTASGRAADPGAAPAAPRVDGFDEAAVLYRLRPVDVLLAPLGKSEDDLDRWLADGLVLPTYRTPDGERLADPAALLAALAEPRTSGAAGTSAVAS